jgi:ABC-type transport system substrate-binding protein
MAITPLPQDSYLPWLVTASGYVPLWHITETLTTIDPRTGVSKVYPRLATEWEMSSDATSYTFKLRKGVPLHFGWGEFTVQDIITTVDKAMSPESVSGCKGRFKPFMGADSMTAMKEMGNLQVIDDHTFTMKLARPQVDIASWWFNNMTFGVCSAAWSSAQFKAQGEAMFEKGPAGTGPYQFVRRTLKEFMEYERVPYKHWRVNPEFKTLRITTAPEEATRLAMLLTKEADMVDIAKVLHDQATAAGMTVLVSDHPDVGLLVFPFGQYYTSKANYNPDLPWAAPGEKGIMVREALNRAVNRKQIINVLFKGLGTPMYNDIFHPSLEGWNPEWEKNFERDYGYDPEKAKKLLDQAGYPGVGGKDRFKMEVWQSSLPGLPETIEVAQSLAQDFKNIGIDVTLVETEFARAIDRFRDRHNADFLLPVRATARPIMQNIQLYHYAGPNDPKSGLPTGGAAYVEIPLVEEVYPALLKETVPAERERLARSVGEVAYKEYRTIPIVWVNSTMVVNPEVVAEYHFGSTTPPFVHLEYVKAVR